MHTEDLQQLKKQVRKQQKEIKTLHMYIDWIFERFKKQDHYNSSDEFWKRMNRNFQLLDEIRKKNKDKLATAS